MAVNHVVTLDSDGHLIYKGLLTAKEIATIDDILNALKEEIPQIERDLRSIHGQTVWYKYYLGSFLGSLLEKYEITVSERRRFWDEIKLLASTEDRKRDEGANSVTRSFYQQCYILSQLDKEVVEKLTWRQWQDILDRVGNREDERIFLWIRQIQGKIREDDWREFEKALNLYLKGKDTSVFETEELFAIYNSLMNMVQKWRIKFKMFSEEHPKSAKIKTRGVWAKKYYARCFELKREQRTRIITEEICDSAYAEVMN